MEAMTATIPPTRKETRLGLTLDRSNAAETKLATMFTPIVATMNPMLTA